MWYFRRFTFVCIIHSRLPALRVESARSERNWSDNPTCLLDCRQPAHFMSRCAGQVNRAMQCYQILSAAQDVFERYTTRAAACTRGGLQSLRGGQGRCRVLLWHFVAEFCQSVISWQPRLGEGWRRCGGERVHVYVHVVPLRQQFMNHDPSKAAPCTWPTARRWIYLPLYLGGCVETNEQSRVSFRASIAMKDNYAAMEGAVSTQKRRRRTAPRSIGRSWTRRRDSRRTSRHRLQ